MGIKDPALADEAAAIENNQDFDADQSRAKIVALVQVPAMTNAASIVRK